jgi:phenylalanyl-tRNA synthetase beta chain
MKVSVEWLNEYTPIKVESKQLCDGLTMSGSKVEGCVRLGEEISNVITARITAIERHPDADKLVICRADAGDRVLQIVTGATNLSVGCIVPVACHGATLPGGNMIKTGKLRGQLSEGMLCSAAELGLTPADFPGADADGIFLLPDDMPVGQDIVQVLQLNDTVIDFEITSNRVDCFSVEGLARETAVTFDQPFKPVVPEVIAASPEQASSLASISIEAPDLCYRYCGRVVRQVKVGPSPAWLRRRLRCAGMRPINNIVDITNYVMLELGQPMHAFDLEQLAGREIRVRRANDREIMRTLDSIDRHLDSSMLVIADRDRAVALAGVMGAENSEITAGTTTILFESAVFNPKAVRQTARKVGLRTESSSRFEKGLDVYNAGRAIDRACQLVEMLAAGVVCPGTIDVWPEKPQPVTVPFNPASINAFLGTMIPAGWMIETLGKLGIPVKSGDEAYRAEIPSFRPDLACEADLSEEIARIYGYNRIQPSLLSGKETTLGGRSPTQKTIEKIKDLLISQGFFEACTYSFESPRQLEKLCLPPGHPLRQTVQIQNPLGEDYSVMRTSMLPSLLQVAATNWSRSVDSARVFEIAYVYRPKALPLAELPEEIRHLTAFAYEAEQNEKGRDFFVMKGIAVELFLHLGLDGIKYQAIQDCPWLHPGQSAAILLDGQLIGQIGVIHPDVADHFAAAPQTVILDLELASLIDRATEVRQYKPLPRFPAVTRDLALLVGTDVPADQLAQVISQAAGAHLEQIKLFDVYQGPQVPAGMKSIAFNLVFRSAERTLSDDDIYPAIQRILAQLKDRCQAILRE